MPIKVAYFVSCSGCDIERGPRFKTEAEAEAWIADDDASYKKKGAFFKKGVPRITDIFHKAGSRLLCLSCVDREIASIRERNKQCEVTA